MAEIWVSRQQLRKQKIIVGDVLNVKGADGATKQFQVESIVCKRKTPGGKPTFRIALEPYDASIYRT